VKAARKASEGPSSTRAGNQRGGLSLTARSALRPDLDLSTINTLAARGLIGFAHLYVPEMHAYENLRWTPCETDAFDCLAQRFAEITGAATSRLVAEDQ
jgi:hypothetical protein